MSRVSLNRRLERLRDTILPPGSMAWRVDRLSDDLKVAYQSHRQSIIATISRARNDGGPGSAYAAFIDGDLALPPMPIAVERALWPEGKPIVTLPAECSLIEASRRYGDMIDGDE